MRIQVDAGAEDSSRVTVLVLLKRASRELVAVPLTGDLDLDELGFAVADWWIVDVVQLPPRDPVRACGSAIRVVKRIA